MENQLKIKVCGMREAKNISDLIKLQPDFIGFIFHKKSPRHIEEKPIFNIPKTTKKVGVFVNKPIDYILKKVKDFNLDYVQLHGNESVQLCQSLIKLNISVIKVFSIENQIDIEKITTYSFCDYILFDTKGNSEGGNGIKFDWKALEAYNLDTPFLLSGGIDLEDIQAIKKLNIPQLAGLDINSKFEVKPALKDIDKIKDFILEIRNSETPEQQ